MIRITSKKDGFRRCGIAHPATPTEHPDGRFTEKELKILQAEPMLVVQVDAAQPGQDPGDAGKKTKPPLAADLIAQITAAGTPEEVDKLLGEDTRATVVAAAAARKEELGKVNE